MDFFERQRRARRNTRVLVVFFALAVVLMVLTIYLVVIALAGFWHSGHQEPFDWFHLEVLAAIACAVCAVVAAGSLYKTWELRAGGKQVALLLGARPILPSTQDNSERRLLNVTEEMALASGVAVPPLYCLDGEGGINAFAAGFAPDDAVIGVSRDTVQKLVQTDARIDLFEFVVQCVLIGHLDRIFTRRKPQPVRYYGLRGVSSEAAFVMSALANAGQRDKQMAEQRFRQAIVPLKLDPRRVLFSDAAECSLPRIQTALEKISLCSMPIKKRLLAAATLVVVADGTITVGEAELLRAIASFLDCPIPPVLSGKMTERDKVKV